MKEEYSYVLDLNKKGCFFVFIEIGMRQLVVGVARNSILVRIARYGTCQAGSITVTWAACAAGGRGAC